MKLQMIRQLIFTLIVSYSLSAQQLTDHVDPFIGTGGHGHTFPGAVRPFGMVQLSPDTRIDGSWDGCGGYHYNDSRLYGFSHTHLSGTGVSDWGDILIMPTIGAPSLDPLQYSSVFSHKNEKASPGYYQVMTDDDGINAELTVTRRTGIHCYTFPKSAEANIILDLLHRDELLASDITIKDSCTVTGYRISRAWAKEQKVYFVMRFSKPFRKYALAAGKKFSTSFNKRKQMPEGAFFQFAINSGEKLTVKVGISGTGVEGAVKNLDAEAPHWDFEKYKTEARSDWEKQLSKIEVSGGDNKKKRIFYTALYHCFIHPSLNMDVDGQYQGRDGKVHMAKGFEYYSVFSLWDTYRALNPLLTILEPERTSDFINTFLAQFSQSGRLPVWELSSNETDCMIGFHAASVIADAMVKNIRGFDSVLAYKAVKAAADYTAFGIPVFNKQGFLQVDDESESVSKTLEYAYDNWCVAQVAERSGSSAEARKYLMRSQAYRNIFDSASGHMRPRKNGNWIRPFDAAEINNHFTEGNSWQYSFYVPHDVYGLIDLHGGRTDFEKKLDELFSTAQKTTGREQADVTGLMGQYAHGNEPSHHMSYLYNYIGKPQKTIERVRKICEEFYSDSPDGLIGNEDCGQMSAWYIFSAMGMYPVCPGSQHYILSAPLFSSMRINLDNGKVFNIESPSNPVGALTEVALNEKKGTRSYLSHNYLVKGGKLEFIFARVEDSLNEYGKKKFALPPGQKNFPPIVPVPLISSGKQVFKDRTLISVVAVNSEPDQVFYMKTVKDKSTPWIKYLKSFYVDSNCIIKCRAVKGGDSSAVNTASFYKLRYNYDVKLVSQPHTQYAAEGPESLIDGIEGTENWRKGDWTGFQGKDLECVVDLKGSRDLSYFSLRFLQDAGAWIVFPVAVSYYISADGVSYSLAATYENDLPPMDPAIRISKFSRQLEKPVKAAFVKIVARNFGTLPPSHPGKGGKAYIFADELEIR